MLLKGARYLTYAAVLTCVGVIMVLISVYTPFGRRVLFFTSGVPVLLAARVWQLRMAASVYAATSLILLLAVNPVKGTGYLLLAGGVPLLQSLNFFPFWTLGLLTFFLSWLYLGLYKVLFGLAIEPVLSKLHSAAPWLQTELSAIILVLGLSFLYNWFLSWLTAGVEKHWVFKQLKP